MADNEIRADIKINVESNAKEAVSEITNAVNKMNNTVTHSGIERTFDDLENSINEYIRFVKEKREEISTGLSEDSLNSLKTYAENIKTIYDSIGKELSETSINMINGLYSGTSGTNVGGIIPEEVQDKIINGLAFIKNEIIDIQEGYTDIDDATHELTGSDTELLAQLLAQEEAEKKIVETAEQYKNILDSALEKHRQMTEESTDFIKNGGAIGSNNRPASQVEAMTGDEKAAYNWYRNKLIDLPMGVGANSLKLTSEDYLELGNTLNSVSNIAENTKQEFRDLSDEFEIASQAIEEYNALLNDLTLNAVNTDTLGFKKEEINNTLSIMNELKDTFGYAFSEIDEEFDVDNKIHNLEKLNSYIDSTIEKYKDTDDLIEKSNGIIEYWEKLDFNDLMPNIDVVGIDNTTSTMESLKNEVDNVKSAIEQLNNTDVFNRDQGVEVEMLKNNLNELLNYIGNVVDAYSNAIDTYNNSAVITDISDIGVAAEQQFDTLNNTLDDTLSAISKLDIFTDKETQSIIGLDDAISKYALDISNLKAQGDDSSWFGNSNDGASYSFQIPELVQETSELKTESSGLANVLGGELTGAFGKLLPALGTGALLLKGTKAAINEAKEAMNDLINIANYTGSALIDAFKSIPELLDNLINKIEQATKKLKTLADQGVNLQKKWFTAYNYLGAQTGSEIRDFLGDIEQVYGIDGDQLVGSLRQISSLVGNVGLNAEDSSKAVKELMTRSIDLSAYSGIDYDSIVNNLQSAINMGYIGRSSPIIRALGLTKEDVETFRQLNSEADRLNFILSKSEHVRGTYEKWLNTSAGRVERLNNSLSRLQGNTQRLALNLWAKVAPVLIKLIDLVNELVSGLAKLLNIDLTSAEANLADTGYIFDGLSEGIGGVSDNLDKTADSLDRTADSADEAKKHLASFDDVIQINDDTSSKMDDELEGLGGSEDFGGSVGLAEALGNFDFGALAGDIEEAKGELQEFFDLLKDGNYYGAGTWIGNYITDKLNSIDWDNIKNKAGEIATNLAAFLNGIFNNKELFKAIGKTIAEALNTGIRFIADFAGNLNWRSVGTALSQSWKSFWYNFDSAELGRALYNVIHGVFEAFWNFVDDMWKTDEYGANGWVLAGYRIADVINNFFSRWDMEDVRKAAQSIIDFIDGVFQMLGAFMKTLDTEDIKAKFQEFIHTLFTGFKEHAAEWGQTLGEFIDFLVDMLEILIKEWDSTGMTGAVLDFLENSHISELLAEWMKIKFKIWWTKLLAEVLVGGEAILKCISDFGGKIGDLLKKIFIGIPLIVLGGAMQLGIDLGNLLGEWGANLGYWLYDLVQNIGAFFEYLGSMLWDGISSAEGGLEDFGGWIYDKVQWIKDTLAEKWNEFQELWGLGIDSIREGWSSFCDGAIGVWDSITGGIKSIFQSVVDFILGGIDRLCSGLTGLLDLLHEVPIVGSAMDGIAGFTGNILGKIDIPFLADGGIVSRATPAIVGEAGKEAVIPLENNTGWMDILANKTAQRLGGVTQSNNQTVVIDMSKSIKPVYTRSEMLAFGKQVADALKIYGVQVSIV